MTIVFLLLGVLLGFIIGLQFGVSIIGYRFITDIIEASKPVDEWDKLLERAKADEPEKPIKKGKKGTK